MAAPQIQSLVGFPQTLKLFPSNNRFESETHTSGAEILSTTAGAVVMRFEVGSDWAFANGTQMQQTTKVFAAGEQGTIEMPWKLFTKLEDAENVRIRVVVKMEDEVGEEASPRTQPVSYSNFFMNLMHKMFGSD